MAGKLKFDELNKLDGRRAMPYEQFFGEMDISEEEKQKRIEMAERFEELFREYFIAYADESNNDDWQTILQERFADIAMLFVTAVATTAYIEDLARQLAEEVTRVTEERAEDDDFWLSDDRAMLIAENESNVVGNYDEYIVAVRSGCTMKRWDSMKDERVRKSHVKMDGTTIPIAELFVVGKSASLMLFPLDTSYGADMNEIAGCRCHATYS